MNLHDSVTVTDARMTADGYLAAEARVARTGIQAYLASELGFDGDPSRIINVYRPPEEVFSADAMKSYAYRPVTLEHPAEMVDAKNWKEHARGQTGGDILREGEFVRVPLVLMDGAAIEEWKNGKHELSMGYSMDLEIIDGVTPNGEAYDAVQRNLRMNHLALVAQARGGSQLKLGDTKLEETDMTERKITTVTVDGLSVETTDAGAQAIAKLKQDLETALKTYNESVESHSEEIEDKDKQLAAKDAKIDELSDKVLDDAALDARVVERADLIAKAKTVADKDYTGKSADAIRSGAVSARLGKDAIDGKSPAYIEARFDMLAEDASQDPVRQVLRDDSEAKLTTVDAAYDARVARTQNAWKGKQKEAI